MSAMYEQVVTTFYGICEAADGIAEPDVELWLAALVLLLAEEVSDPPLVVRLAQEAAGSLDTSPTVSPRVNSGPADVTPAVTPGGGETRDQSAS